MSSYNYTMLIASALLLLHNSIAAATSSKPATIVNVTKGGVGVVDYSSNQNGLNALIGTWDSPYGGGPNGPPEPGKEPKGVSKLDIEIDVNGGALLTFAYKYKTWDTGNWDWLDINIETPDGTENITRRLGRPGLNYGNYFESSRIDRSISLHRWRNKRISLKLSVQHDGWGDQTQAELIGLALRTCAVTPLSPITDPEALRFEQGDQINTEALEPNMQSALDCLENAVTAANGQLNIESAYRPTSYQMHLQEVWDKWVLLKDKREPECSALREEVRREFSKHGLLPSQRPAGENGPHTTGRAVDISSTLGMSNLVPLAERCGLYRPIPGRDPVHFQHR